MALRAIIMLESYVCWMGGQILRASDIVSRSVKSIFPSQVLEVSHHMHGIAEHVYLAKTILSNWSSAFCTNMYLSYEGFYRIIVWNSSISSYQLYFLSASHLEKAINSRHLFSWWAMTDFGIVTMLSSYMAMMQVDKSYIVGMMIHGEDVTQVLKPYFPSLCLRHNCTARAVVSLYHELVGTHPKKVDDDEVVFVDCDMVEHKRVNDEYLFE